MMQLEMDLVSQNSGQCLQSWLTWITSILCSRCWNHVTISCWWWSFNGIQSTERHNTRQQDETRNNQILFNIAESCRAWCKSSQTWHGKIHKVNMITQNDVGVGMLISFLLILHSIFYKCNKNHEICDTMQNFRDHFNLWCDITTAFVDACRVSTQFLKRNWRMPKYLDCSILT